ncbi:MAG: hypothetical protein E5W89_28485 [Mesorhizobium sp.]|nr:MAG: hypothetical protein E5W89_28485 [Mesorhizobium sp.]
MRASDSGPACVMLSQIGSAKMLKFGSGYSGNVNSAAAMREAVLQADADQATVLIIHTTVGHNFGPMLAAASETCPHTAIVGCTGSGVIYSHGVSETMRALAVMSIAGPEVAVIFRDGLTRSNGRGLVAEAAQELQGKLDGINVILLYTPGLDVTCDEVLAGIESVFGREVPIVGGLAADNAKVKSSFQFYGQSVTEHGLLLVGLADPGLELLSMASHGSRPVGEPFVVTAAEGSQVQQLDGLPAWPKVMQRLGLPAETSPVQAIPLAALGIEIDSAARDDYNNSHIMRAALQTDGTGGFYLNSRVRVGTKLFLMHRDEEKIFAGVTQMMSRMATMVDGREVVAVFHADCLARGRQSLDRVSKDEIIAKLQRPLIGDREVPWLGLYGYGEFCPLMGRNSLHTFTSALFPLVRQPAI